ncbi:NAGLU domain-containing protein/NAGLU_N domain-containing protein/NAGLU_C domain-containing protein, partial [Cephalotus follicularis]
LQLPSTSSHSNPYKIHHSLYKCNPDYHRINPNLHLGFISSLPSMDSWFPAILILLIVSAISSARPSTIGVQYMSRLLDIQDRERAPASVQLAAARAVLQRLLPSHASAFDFQIVSKEQCGGEYCFIIKNHPSYIKCGDPEILISGITAVEVLAGLHWYMKNWCGAHISWDKTGGAQLFSTPRLGSLPLVQDAGILVQRPIPWNYYQNAVTSSYSFAWWDWKRWEKEIDWMALQGINMPLAFTGQEAIWQKVFQKFNMSNSDLETFFGGPAFLAWSRMANLHGWGGPLPQSWFDQQLTLQKKILGRMYELGMTPVLPAFSGNVPAALKYVYPSAKITRLGNWFSIKSDPRWCCTYLLDATDPLFIEIGRAFIEQQLKEYGRTGHIYNCDTFDENTPPVDDPEYISSLGAATFKGMQSGDNDAVWLMQGWLFSYDPFWRPPQMKALLHSVPTGRCMLHNFAGNIEMYGILDAIASGPVEARTSKNSTMVGVGMSMEGIEQNPVVYDLMSEMAFQPNKVNVKVWIDLYPARRYGRTFSLIQEAWNILYHTVYNCTDSAFDKNRDVIVAFPDVDPYSISTLHGRYHHYDKPISRRAVLKENTDSYNQPHLWYSPSEVIHALELFIACGDELSGSDTYRYDLVDLTRQALAKYANDLFLKVIEAYQLSDVNGVVYNSEKFLDLVKDLDLLLASHDGFLLGPWLESAKQLAQDQKQEQQFEWNARTQITMWFDNTEEEASLLRDYGNKYWSGLLRDYYGPRAAIYFRHLVESLENGHGFMLKEWRREWIKLTNDWQKSRNVFPVKGVGNALNISRWLYNKYLRNSDTYDL